MNSLLINWVDYLFTPLPEGSTYGNIVWSHIDFNDVSR